MITQPQKKNISLQTVSVHLLSISIPLTKIYLHSIHLYTINLHAIDFHSTYLHTIYLQTPLSSHHLPTTYLHATYLHTICTPAISYNVSPRQTSLVYHQRVTPPAIKTTTTTVPRCHLPVLHSTRLSVFPNVLDSHQTSRHDRCEIKLLPTTEPTNIRCHCTKFSRP